MNAEFTLWLPDALLIALGLLLLVAAAIDVGTYTIPNRLNLLIAVLAPLFWWSAELALWPDVAIRIGAALLVFGLLAAAFAAGMMGGGDVKLAAAVALWFPPLATVKMLVVMSIAGGVLTLLVLLIHRARQREGRPKIPYGVAIAAGGWAVLAERYLNQFA
ncbi:MAG: Type IV prepilin peptidase TadV/CpaA [uncultured Sphingomonas sp.]|uniref:Type IV prepilin peptidase TadV/CpaA n=1 Tax=uncultured Sphingomonas sp. TaxID=158754 RepID=A0A6J4TXI1_9SPHN|nr:prepilin peptidase [uncultured Sphingomonas sp.]CAA9532946.1 MAG: Type IV prepilin peptidase TadV/CpaA [uncultured Sphingomonas sp.]